MAKFRLGTLDGFRNINLELSLIIKDKAPATQRYAACAKANEAAKLRQIAALRALRLCFWNWANGPGSNPRFPRIPDMRIDPGTSSYCCGRCRRRRAHRGAFDDQHRYRRYRSCCASAGEAARHRRCLKRLAKQLDSHRYLESGLCDKPSPSEPRPHRDAARRQAAQSGLGD